MFYCAAPAGSGDNGSARNRYAASARVMLSRTRAASANRRATLALEACDKAGVIIWRRRHGWAWIDRASALAGDTLARRDGFLSMSDAALDAVLCLGLPAELAQHVS